MDRREFLRRSGPEPSAREVIRRKCLPNVELRTHQGRRVRFYDDLVRDRCVTINFMYIACSDGTCPMTTHNLARIQKLLAPHVGRDLFMYSITLNPEYDTPQHLAAYAGHFGAGPGWLFLQASPADTERLRRCLGFYETDPEADRVKSNHAAMIRYGNEPRTLWCSTRGLIDPAVAARSIRWVL